MSPDGSAVRTIPYGPRAALIDLGDGSDPAALAAALRARLGEGVTIVPAARTVLVDGLDAELVAAHVDQLGAAPRMAASAGGETITIAVDYDGPDLAWTAARCGMSVEEVVAAHTAPTYVCAFCGFAPGFAYLSGLDPRLVVPRREAPRTSVPSGSVAIAAEHTAIYPRSTPGGWRLIGRSDAVMWDLERGSRPALVEPGDRVRFVAR